MCSDRSWHAPCMRPPERSSPRRPASRATSRERAGRSSTAAGSQACEWNRRRGGEGGPETGGFVVRGAARAPRARPPGAGLRPVGYADVAAASGENSGGHLPVDAPPHHHFSLDSSLFQRGQRPPDRPAALGYGLVGMGGLRSPTPAGSINVEAAADSVERAADAFAAGRVPRGTGQVIGSILRAPFRRVCAPTAMSPIRSA